MQLKIESRYFNTVGSKEGWTPSTFVSSRNNRLKDGDSSHTQQPEDFMDEEDLAEAAEKQGLQTQNSFASLGKQTQSSTGLMYLSSAEAPDDRAGNKLLQRMGWRDGQGIGPKVLRKARLDEDADGDASEIAAHYFAPEDTKMITFSRKDDSKGLGFTANEISLHRTTPKADNEFFMSESSSNKNGAKKTKSRPAGGFGIGILNDNGSDDEDPYEVGPRISYNKTVTPKSKKKNSKNQKSFQSSANPLLTNSPMFQSRKVVSSMSQMRSKCHDGQPPIDGFILADLYEAHTLNEKASLPQVPAGWKPSKIGVKEKEPGREHNLKQPTNSKSLHNPTTRAAALGETALPGKSIFDFISSGNRDRIADASKRPDLPAGLGQHPTDPTNLSESTKSRDGLSAYYVTKETAVGALHRSMLRGMPYSDDADKLKRYRHFLQISAGLIGDSQESTSGTQDNIIQSEYQEFAQTARVFQPISSTMASRFISSSATPENISKQSSSDPMASGRPSDNDNINPAEAAARSGMYGSLTRKIIDFYPTRLVCKRFGVQHPTHVQNEGETGNKSDDLAATANVNQQLALKAVDVDSNKESRSADMTVNALPNNHTASERQPSLSRTTLDLEKNEALESERAGDELFHSIFGSDDT